MVAQASQRARTRPRAPSPYNAAQTLRTFYAARQPQRNGDTDLKEQKNLPEAYKNTSADQALGLDRDITRRDFLNATLLASGGALLHSISPAQLLGQHESEGGASATDEWTGYGGVGDYASSNGNTL